MQNEGGREGVRIAVVVAVAENGVIGRDNRLPWRMPTDLATFRRLTLGKPVVMGRKTFQSLGKPLAGRVNIVVSRDPSFAPPAGVIVLPSLTAALGEARREATERNVEEVAVIGGAQIYRETLAVADRVCLTRIHAAPEGDATFPPLDGAVWAESSRTPLVTSERDDHAATLIVYERRPPDRGTATPVA
jgi:dihydrofolate reductase